MSEVIEMKPFPRIEVGPATCEGRPGWLARMLSAGGAEIIDDTTEMTKAQFVTSVRHDWPNLPVRLVKRFTA